MRARGDDADETASGATAVLAVHPSSELYGSDRMFLESVAGMREAGWSVVAALPQDGPLVNELEATGAEVVLVAMPVLRKSALSPRGALGMLGVSLLVARRSWALTRAADVVYVSTLTVPTWLGIAAAAGRPSLAHVHEAEASAPALLRHAMAAPLELASGLVVNSRFARDVLARSSRRSGRRAEVVPNGVAGPPAAVDPREHLEGPLRVLYVGRLSPRKGVDVAVEAVVALTERGVDVHLDLVGAVYDGYEWFEQRLRDRVGEAGVADRVTFWGFHADVWGFAAASDVVVVPSRIDEPFGNTAVEAVLARRPVVVSDSSGLREAAAGYASAQAVPPGDPSALAAALESVVRDWPRVRAAAVSSAEEASTRHSLAEYRSTVVDRLAHLRSSQREREQVGLDPQRGELSRGGTVTIGVLTYRRPDELAALLPVLIAMAEASHLPADVLVVDNDPAASGESVVEAAGSSAVRYAHEPVPGIAAARNTALREAGSDLLVFIDDDEVPVEGWLELMVRAHELHGGAVVGPVVSRYRGEPDPWVASGRFFDRRRHVTGSPVRVAATNNLLLDLRVVQNLGLEFDVDFGLSGGSDTLFTRQLDAMGGTMIWCDEALVVDEVPGERLTPSWVMRRALRSGNSWSRTSLVLADSRVRRARTRAVLAGTGALRLAGGSARWSAGVLRRDIGSRARGARTVARGVGLVSGAAGWVYAEYRRPASGTGS